MARTWPGGDADTDKVVVAPYAAINDLLTFSFSVWMYRSNNGGSANGRVLSRVNSFQVYWAAPNLFFSALRWTGTFGEWRTGGPSTPDEWHHYVVTYDYTGGVGVDPLMYFDGTIRSIVETSTPVGTATNSDTSNNFVIGNIDAALRCWGGRLQHVSLWNRILSADEVRYLFAVAPNAPQQGGALVSGLVLYLPLLGTTSPEPNSVSPANTGTVTGTTTGAANQNMFVPVAGANTPISSRIFTGY